MNKEEATRASFTYQLEMLKAEIETVNTTIRQGDEITKSIKEWTITIWAGAVGGALAIGELRAYVWATAAIPLLFWLVDTWHRVVQRKFIWRSLAIMDFLNDDRLEQSFREQKLINFTVMDIASRRDRSAKFRQFISWRRVMLFRSLSILYIGLSNARINPRRAPATIYIAGSIMKRMLSRRRVE